MPDSNVQKRIGGNPGTSGGRFGIRVNDDVNSAPEEPDDQIIPVSEVNQIVQDLIRGGKTVGIATSVQNFISVNKIIHQENRNDRSDADTRLGNRFPT